MEIIWNKDKNDWLILNRGISFEEISELIMNNRFKDILINPARENQLCFIIEINDYTWIVPFMLDERDNIILKTAFPSRKFHKKYGDIK